MFELLLYACHGLRHIELLCLGLLCLFPLFGRFILLSFQVLLQLGDLVVQLSLLLGGLRTCLLELTLQICVFSLEGILNLLIRALRLPNRNVVLIILPNRLGNLKVLLRDCAPKLSDLIVFILQLVS